MKLENIEMAFKPYEVIHMRLPNASDFFEGMTPVQAGAKYIDNDPACNSRKLLSWSVLSNRASGSRIRERPF